MFVTRHSQSWVWPFNRHRLRPGTPYTAHFKGWARLCSAAHLNLWTRNTGTMSWPKYDVLHCTVLYCTVLYCTVLYCTALYCTVLYCTVLHYTVLYCTVLYFAVLYFITVCITTVHHLN